MLQPALQNHFLLRDLKDSDLLPVSALADRVWRAHYITMVTMEQIDYMLKTNCSPDAMAKQIKENNQRFFVLEEDGAITGYIALEPRTPGEWYIDKLYIDLEKQRGGMGVALLTHAKKILKPKSLTLRVNRSNVKAINFYFKQGFFITEMNVKQLDHGYVMDDYLMRWNA